MALQEVTSSRSVVQRLDPRVKLVVAVAFSVVVAVSHHFVILTWASVLALCIVVLTRVPAKELFRRLVPVNLFVVFLWIFLPFTVDGQGLFSIGPLVGSYEGVLYAAEISIKSNIIVAVLIALVASTSIFTLGQALHELKAPKKIVHLFFFTYRYIHVIHREYVRLLNAMKIRGFRPKTNIHTYKTFAFLVGMLLVRSSERAERVYRAMLCRGFRGKLYSLHLFSMTTMDVVSLICMLAMILTLGVMEWML